MQQCYGDPIRCCFEYSVGRTCSVQPSCTMLSQCGWRWYGTASDQARSIYQPPLTSWGAGWFTRQLVQEILPKGKFTCSWTAPCDWQSFIPQRAADINETTHAQYHLPLSLNNSLRDNLLSLTRNSITTGKCSPTNKMIPASHPWSLNCLTCITRRSFSAVPIEEAHSIQTAVLNMQPMPCYIVLSLLLLH